MALALSSDGVINVAKLERGGNSVPFEPHFYHLALIEVIWRNLALALALGSAGVGDKAEVVVRLTLRQDLKSNGVRRLLIFSDRDLGVVGVVGVGVLASAFPRLKVFRLITRAS